MVHLLEYLNSPDFFKESVDEFGIKTSKNIIINLATELQQRLFKQQVATETVKETTKLLSDSNVNNEGLDQGGPTKILTLSEEFQVFLNESEQQIEEVQSVCAQIINKEMQLFEVTKKRPENLEKIYPSLLTVRSTSVEAERAFSAMGLFLSKSETD